MWDASKIQSILFRFSVNCHPRSVSKDLSTFAAILVEALLCSYDVKSYIVTSLLLIALNAQEQRMSRNVKTHYSVLSCSDLRDTVLWGRGGHEDKAQSYLCVKRILGQLENALKCVRVRLFHSKAVLRSLEDFSLVNVLF